MLNCKNIRNGTLVFLYVVRFGLESGLEKLNLGVGGRPRSILLGDKSPQKWEPDLPAFI